jgi:ABC-type multidrug transport system fused ATPase/permease subunit
MRNKLKQMIMIMSAILLVSCPSTEPTVDPDKKINPTPAIERSIEIQDEVSNSITTETGKTIAEAEKIKGETKKIGEKVPDKVDQEIKNINQHTDNIIDFQRILQFQADKLTESKNKLNEAQSLVSDLQKHNADISKDNKVLKKEKEQAQKEKQAALFSKLIYLIITSIICLALCVVSALRGEPKAIWGAVGSGVVMIIALAVSFFSIQFAIVGFIAVVAGLGLAIYIGFKNHADKKATTELVQTVEMAKSKLKREDKVDLFGTGAQIGKSHAIQSKSTNKIVHQIRKQEKEHWEPTILYRNKQNWEEKGD